MRWLLQILVLVLVSMTLPPRAAISHELNWATNATEEAVFHFYATWYRPPERTFSCCNYQDCHVVQIKREGERYYFFDTVYFQGWREIPQNRLEHNAQDPRESPDGNSHVCFNSMYILCAVLGSGQ